MHTLPPEAEQEMRRLVTLVDELSRENVSLNERLIDGAERQASSRDSIVKLRDRTRQQREAINVLTHRIADLKLQNRLDQAYSEGRAKGIHETYERWMTAAAPTPAVVLNTEGAATAQNVSAE